MMGVGANSIVNRALEVTLSAIHMTLIFGEVALNKSCLPIRSWALCAQPESSCRSLCLLSSVPTWPLCPSLHTPGYLTSGMCHVCHYPTGHSSCCTGAAQKCALLVSPASGAKSLWLLLLLPSTSRSFLGLGSGSPVSESLPLCR